MLIVDDSKVDRTLLANLFAGSYKVLQASGGRESLDVLARGKVDIVVLDIGMEGMDGFAVLEAMKADPDLADIPVIVETCETAHEETALTCGADDFIAKPFNPVVARKRVDNIVVKHVLERERLQAALRETELLAARRAQELLHVAEHDRLTGLYNRTAFCRKTAELLAAHPDEEFAVIQFDIERFKIINELYGSAKGDEVLLAIASTLGEWLHVAGVYGRMEGDRFALCLPHDVALEGDYVRALEEAVAATEVDRQVVLYFGVYEIEDRTMPVDIMCDRANLALHSVKGDYNTHFALYDSDMHQTFLANHELVGEGERALREGRFEPFVQPVFDLATGALVSGEALVRWRDPQKGLVPPGQFLPFFENSGFIIRLDGHIREAVCQLLVQMSEQRSSCPPVSVNVSRLEFYDPRFCQNLIDLVSRYNVPPSLLRLEITESAYADNLPQLLEAMAQLQSHGFTVLMDDFGAGYSSLSMLRDVPVDMIKLDMRFLGDGGAGAQEREKGILKAIVPMAKSLGLPIIAEGVETADQAAFLKSIGCDYVQGFLYARPMPRDEYVALVAAAAAATPGERG